MKNELLENIEKLHTTPMGVDRIRRNLSLGDDVKDVVAFCQQKILDDKAEISRQGKNWYVKIDGCIITVNAYSYTIITAHKE
jgi:hypothetical protein